MRWLLRLYPRVWRERYEAEMLALLEQHRCTWHTTVDLVREACEAHYHQGVRRHRMADSLHGSRPVTLAGVALAGIALVFGLMLSEIVAHPGSIRGAGSTSVVLLAVGLLLYTAAILWCRRRPEARVQTALAQGAKFGAILAGGAWLNMALEHFAPLGPTGSMARGVGMWALMFISFGAAGSAAYQRSGSLGVAMLSGIWSALVSTTATLLFGFALAALFGPYLERIQAAAYLHSGMGDPRAFVIRNTLESASIHLLLAPVLACLFGLIGGGACMFLSSLQQGAAKIVGGLEVAVLIAGITALRLAALLARAERPPFIMTGLLALGLAMACAHPVFTAIRRSTVSSS